MQNLNIKSLLKVCIFKAKAVSSLNHPQLTLDLHLWLKKETNKNHARTNLSFVVFSRLLWG